MSGIETVGLILGVLPILISGLESYQDALRYVKPIKIPSRKVNRLHDEYGLLMPWVLTFFFRDALNVMAIVERYVLRAEDQQVEDFIKSYTSSFSMIGVAVRFPGQISNEPFADKTRAPLSRKSPSRRSHLQD
jgi:hypothetical protein